MTGLPAVGRLILAMPSGASLQARQVGDQAWEVVVTPRGGQPLSGRGRTFALAASRCASALEANQSDPFPEHTAIGSPRCWLDK